MTTLPASTPRTTRPPRRAALLAACGFAALLAGCANLPGLKDPPRVNLVGLESLPGESMEFRLAVKLRVQNPNEQPIEYDGVSLQMDVGGREFASGVSPEKGAIPRYGDVVLTVPMTVSAWAVARQALSLAQGSALSVDYVMKGRLGSTSMPLVNAARFEQRGQVDLPTTFGASR